MRAAQDRFVNGGVIPPNEETFLLDGNVSKLYDEPGTRSKVLIELRSLLIRMLLAFTSGLLKTSRSSPFDGGSTKAPKT